MRLLLILLHLDKSFHHFIPQNQSVSAKKLLECSGHEKWVEEGACPKASDTYLLWHASKASAKGDKSCWEIGTFSGCF
jgi:hypothetical protein